MVEKGPSNSYFEGPFAWSGTRVSRCSGGRARRTISPMTNNNGGGWAVTGALFAGTWMLIVGGMQAFQGLMAVLNDDVFVKTPNYVFQLDLTSWGWIHMVIGALLFVVGLFVLNGSPWARWTGVVLAALTIVSNFLWLPYYPFWSIILMAGGAWAIWGLTTAPRDYKL